MVITGTTASDFLLITAAESLRFLDSFLSTFELWGAHTWLSVSQPSVYATLMASIAVLLMMIPIKPAIRLCCILLGSPALLLNHRPSGQLELEMLDVGQGLSVLVKAGSRQLLYDTGPGDGHSWSLAGSAIIPALQGKAPDAMIVSHGDLDHAGGLFELIREFPNTSVMMTRPGLAAGTISCQEQQAWAWSGLEMTVLHPSSGLPYLGNDSSCVLSLRYGDFLVLLTGDIGSSIEQRLVSRGLAGHDVLFAPHHGSKSSSSENFVQAVNPRWALVSTAYHNSFNFPDPSVRARYKAHQVPLYDTAACGAIRLGVNIEGGVQLSSARRERTGVWRWPADEECP